ncbi:MAG: VOC family protein, partial [Planctomycetota bacterium]
MSSLRASAAAVCGPLVFRRWRMRSRLEGMAWFRDYKYAWLAHPPLVSCSGVCRARDEFYRPPMPPCLLKKKEYAYVMTVTRLDHLNLTVRDFDETASWYGRVFGFEVVEKETDAQGRPWGVLRAGDALLCIYE